MKHSLQTVALRPADPFAGDDVLAGLRQTRKSLPCKLLYDARGAQLFEQICTVEEYYPYRSELALLDQHLPAIAQAIGPAARVIEPGSGAGQKTRMLAREIAARGATAAGVNPALTGVRTPWRCPARHRCTW